MIKALATALFLTCLASPLSAQTARDVEIFDGSMVALRDGDWRAALQTAEGVSPVARDIIEWHRLRAGQGDFDSVQRFLDRRSDWPGLKLLRRRSEPNLPLGSRADDVLEFFAPQVPQTGAGAMSLVAAYRAKGFEADAEAEAVHAWLTHEISAADENRLLDWYGKALKPHHENRLDMLLWRNARKGAERMFKRVDKAHVALAKARIALRGNKNGVDKLVSAVPKALSSDPGLMFERMQWRAQKGRNAPAIDLMLAQSPDNLGEAARWGGWRRAFARAEMRQGRIENAYDLASQHGLTSGSHFADLEWISGYLALTYRNDPQAALGHFLKFRGAVDSPISLGRAGYWEGRTHEELGDAESARLSYLFGAEYQTSFYGQLAAEKAGVDMKPSMHAPIPANDWKQSGFADSSVFEAGRLLMASGELYLAMRFMTHLSESLSATDVARLGAFVLEEDQPHIAVMIGKRVAPTGTVVPFLYYPVADLGVSDMPVPAELALSIARRESEFNPGVTSGVGARGLMQVMPATAREVAGYLEIPYSKDRLLNDAAYNARIGIAYLDELMTVFDGNVVMVSAGYNAGPSRPMRWMENRGDPRRGRSDVIDWIEHIPFDETRNYVMRVAESMAVYRARLTGQPQPMTLSKELVSRNQHQRAALKGALLRPAPRPAPLTD